MSINDISRLEFIATFDDLFPEAEKLYVEWLHKYSNTKQAVFLLEMIVKHRASCAEVGAEAEKWIEMHAETGRANLLFRAMLRSGYSVEYLESGICEWLDANPMHESVGELIMAWHLAGGRNKNVLRKAKGWAEGSTAIEAEQVLALIG